MGNRNSVCCLYCCCDNSDASTMGQSVPICNEPEQGRSSSVSAAVAEGSCQSILDISKDGVDADLSALIDYIHILLNYAKRSCSSSSSKDVKHERREWKFADATDLSKLKDLFSESAEVATGLISNKQSATVRDVAKTVLKVVGKAHWVTAGLLAVSYVLERFDLISSNQAECVDVLEEMCRLMDYLYTLKQRRGLKNQIAGLMEESLQLVVQAAAVCFFQSKSSWWYKFLGASVEKEQLEDIHQHLEKTYKHLLFQVILRTYDANHPLDLPRTEFYPKHAVIPPATFEEIVEMLELESEKKVVAVILYGLGGIGKTTLADAVYARVDDVLGFRFAKAALYENTGSKPHTLSVQRKILAAISENQVSEEPCTVTDGQKLMLKYFEKQPCFLYIDNVLDGEELRKLLPPELDGSRKLRLLLTARDWGVRSGVDVRSREDVKVFSVESLAEEEAMKVLMKQMGSRVVAHVKEEERQYLLHICGGMPLLIEMIGRFLRYETDTREALKSIREEQQQGRERFGGEHVEFLSFAFDGLEECYREAFLDVCAFFHTNWPWRYLEWTMGKDIMQVLERRALVKRCHREYSKGVMLDTDFDVDAKVHDVVLEMGLRRCRSNRIITVSQFRAIVESPQTPAWYDILVRSVQDALRGIKGIFLQENLKGEKLILPWSKLNLMSASLRILATGFRDPNDYDRSNVIEVEDEVQVQVGGECSYREAFPSLVYWDTQDSNLQPPLAACRFTALRSLICVPNRTVDWHQIPANLKWLELYFRHEAFVAESENAVAAPDPEHAAAVMSSLETLGMVGKNLREIPRGLLAQMKSLVELYLRDCPQLFQVPDELHTLPHLQSIWIRDVALTELPPSIGVCASLKRLLFKNCIKVEQLPPGIENLCLLQSLNLSGCTSLQELPRDIGKLVSLKFLSLYGCTSLKNLGATFSSLPSLETLDLSQCCMLETYWMAVFVKMRSLKVLYLWGCAGLITGWQHLDKHGIDIKCIYDY